MKIVILSGLSAVAVLALGGFWFSLPAKAQAPKRAAVVDRSEPNVPPPMTLYERTSVPEPSPPAVTAAPAAQVDAAPAASIEGEHLEYENRFDSERGRSGLQRLETVVTTAAARIAVPGSQLEKIECRESICKLSLRFDDAEVDNDFFYKITHLDDRSEDTAYLGSFDLVIPERAPTPDGKIRVEAYLKTPTPAP